MLQKNFEGFKDFVREKGIIGLAVGFIMAGAVAKLVSALVTDIINPIIGIVAGTAKNLEGSYLQVGQARILYGHFFGALIDFLLIVIIVYSGIKIFKLDTLEKKKTQ